MLSIKPTLLLLALSFAFFTVSAQQNFLTTKGTAIVNQNEDTVILKGMGLGGWMVQEGYMLQTAGFANPQHEIRETFSEAMGKEHIDSFYNLWLNNYITKADMDSLKAWGFNSIRLPMHYNLYTPPIEDEPIAGEITWLKTGFELTDSVIKWCADNEMWVILDLHAAPGGQGGDAAISDYDSDKPSLWESEANKRKCAALWGRLAKKYANNEWVAGYDLLNEPNWELPGNVDLRKMYVECTDSIRKYDKEHIIIIEGNWWANDFTGLTPPWDNQIVYSPHKYWSYNNVSTMQYATDLRAQTGVPVYLGETGENSNVWFRDAIRLFEDLGIGWAMWPIKKVESVSGIMSYQKPKGYQQILDYGNDPDNNTPISKIEAKKALFDLAKGTNIQLCEPHADVIDAMSRQVYSKKTIPFKNHKIPGVIYASDFDYGQIGHAYYDNEYANYSVSSGNYTPWNSGWAYRNDGMDIEPTTTNTLNSNGYNLGWLYTGEWAQYSIKDFEPGVYSVKIRIASGSSGGFIKLLTNESGLTERTFVGPTGGWQTWKNMKIENVILTEDMENFRFFIDKEGYNLASFEFIKEEKETTSVTSVFTHAKTVNEQTIEFNANKPFKSTENPNITVYANNKELTIESVQINPENNRAVIVKVNEVLNYLQEITISFDGNNIGCFDGTNLTEFEKEPVSNQLPIVHQLPGKIEAEDFNNQSGIEMEECQDEGTGFNLSYLDQGDYAEYEINVTEAGKYMVNFRTASPSAGGGVRIQFINDNGTQFNETINFEATGDWQNWETTSKLYDLPVGRYLMKVTITRSLFNINWISFSVPNALIESETINFSVFPNPSKDQIVVASKENIAQVIILDIYGRELFKFKPAENKQQLPINISALAKGQYLIITKQTTGTISSCGFVKN